MEGRKRTESWDDKQTGAKQYRDLVYVERIEFLDSKGTGKACWSYEWHRRRDNSAGAGRAVLTNDVDSSSLYSVPIPSNDVTKGHSSRSDRI